jgi:UDP-GlcNAc:undecaprenyl-phosphate GlcNAc-1-phosphate transferase
VQLVTLPIGGITVVPPVLGLVLTVGAVVLVMNAVNFIDGLDGLVAGVVIIANGVFFIYSYWLARVVAEAEYFNLTSLITVVLIGACAGFLPLNWHPAKLFMGDSGALLVGLLMATSAISVTGQIDPESLQSGRLLAPAFIPFIPILLPLAILIVPLLDFALAVTRRLSAGKSPFSADRQHLHHRLLDMGHTHFQAVLIFYSWTAVVAVGVLSFLFIPWGWSIVLIVVGLGITTVVTLAPLSRRMRRAASTKGTSS